MENNIYNKNLTELRSSRYEIADGEPDIRGWEVKTSQGMEIGKVKELLFDISSLKVRYVIINLNGKPLNLISRDLIIPIGLAELYADNKVVIFPEVTVGHLATLPEYKKGMVSIKTEKDIRSVFAPSRGVAYVDPDYYDPEDFYNNEYFDEKRMNKNRNQVLDRDNTGEPGNLRERIIPTERARNIDQPATTETSAPRTTVQEGSFAPFQEGVIEIKEHSEVPVVSKQARVVEEISVNKEVSERDEKVIDSVRRTEVDIEKLNKDDLSKKNK